MFKRRVFYGFSFLLIIWLSISSWLNHQVWNRVYPKTEGNTCTIFLIDGLDNKIFKRLIDEGRLPCLKSLMDSGIYVENGISSFPTMTGYGFYPFVTGVDATLSGILGLRWFDRTLDKGNLRNYVGKTHVHMNDDLTDTTETFFEKSGQYYTASINTYMNRGVKHAIMTGWEHTTAKYEGKSFFYWLRAIPFLGSSIAKDHFEHESHATHLALRQVEKNPKIHWITYPSPDAYNHVHGTDEQYSQLISHIDSLICAYVAYSRDTLKQHNRMFAIVSDHGISDVNENIDFCGWMKESYNLNITRGKSVNIWSSSLNEPIENLKSFDGYFVINGNLTAYLYLKNPSLNSNDQWKFALPDSILLNYPSEQKTIHIPEVIASNPKIELVIYKSGLNEISILSGNQKALINNLENKLRYIDLTGNPLDYADTLVNRYLSDEEWLDFTAETNFPYAVPRIYNLMNQQGIGDIVMTSRKGVDLANDYEIFVGNYKGGHGGIRKEVISVPYIISIPGGKAQIINAMRNEDVGIIIKEFLGF
ncbi:MAG: alkaline phosphatase family protein [Saprospiraceae bacterium]|nr:alkaline phosphatase family protein [Saprospiraceae bacterium]